MARKDQNTPSFQDRMYLAGEAIYAAIERGEYQTPEQVEAAVLDANLQASSDGQN